jgi:hypothetical protein
MLELHNIIDIYMNGSKQSAKRNKMFIIQAIIVCTYQLTLHPAFYNYSVSRRVMDNLHGNNNK